MMRLGQLLRACEKSAARDTAYEPLQDQWSINDPLSEHCGATAYVVQVLLGGLILSGRDEEGTRWLRNKLPNGREVSLVSPHMAPPTIRRRVVVKGRKTVNRRHALFLYRVKATLANAF